MITLPVRLITAPFRAVYNKLNTPKDHALVKLLRKNGNVSQGVRDGIYKVRFTSIHTEPYSDINLGPSVVAKEEMKFKERLVATKELPYHVRKVKSHIEHSYCLWKGEGLGLDKVTMDSSTHSSETIF